MKSKVTKIIPEGATLTRADGSAVNVGDEVSDGEALTITMQSGGSATTHDGVVVFDGPVVAGIAERLSTVAVPPVLAVGDAAPTTRLPRATTGTPPAVKVIT